MVSLLLLFNYTCTVQMLPGSPPITILIVYWLLLLTTPTRGSNPIGRGASVKIHGSRGWGKGGEKKKNKMCVFSFHYGRNLGSTGGGQKNVPVRLPKSHEGSSRMFAISKVS